MALETLEPYDIISDITSLLPSQALEASPALTREKYLQDLWTVFSEPALIDPQLAEMHQLWFEVWNGCCFQMISLISFQCRQPDVRELWQARYPPKGAKHSLKGSTRQAALRTVLTLEHMLARVPREQFPELHRSFSVLYLDYLMLMGVMCEWIHLFKESRNSQP